MENKTMIKLVVATEAMFFLALVMVYVYMWHKTGFSKSELDLLDLKSAAVLTFVLLFSSFTLWMSERSYTQQKYKQVKIWLILTLSLGLLFLIGQGTEYVHLIQAHITIGSTSFGTSFFTLTGFHGLHVFVGIIVLSILLFLFVLGDFRKQSSSALSVASIYWHFVDVLWLVVFTVVYVFPQFISN
jgi:heme/copper-type cytochrome/quinol oxidase subunit 3